MIIFVHRNGELFVFHTPKRRTFLIFVHQNGELFDFRTPKWRTFLLFLVSYMSKFVEKNII
jgi:hypothetical protein